MGKTHISIILLCAFLGIGLLSSCGSGSSRRKAEYDAKERTIREIQFGKLLAAEILRKYPALADEKATRYVNLVGKSVALFAGRADIDYHFAILNISMVNAYATPGGYIFITKGALLEMKNEAELAGVLAHEIAHVNLMHIMKELPPPREVGGVVDRLASVLVAQGAVVSSAFAGIVGKAKDILFSRGYKIEDEYEADRTAVVYIGETGYYPYGLIDFLRRIKPGKGEDASLQAYNTHPSFTVRIARLQEAVKSSGLIAARPMQEKRFRDALGHLTGTSKISN